jgi:hypothetical protein
LTSGRREDPATGLAHHWICDPLPSLDAYKGPARGFALHWIRYLTLEKIQQQVLLTTGCETTNKFDSCAGPMTGVARLWTLGLTENLCSQAWRPLTVIVVSHCKILESKCSVGQVLLAVKVVGKHQYLLSAAQNQRSCVSSESQSQQSALKLKR